MKSTNALSLILIIALASLSHATDLSSCPWTLSSGTYDLTSNISNLGANTCFDTSSSNIYLDCHGYTISISGIYHGILMRSSAQNVTLNNCIFSGTGTNVIYFSYGGDNLVLNNSIINSTSLPVLFWPDANNNIVQNTYLRSTGSDAVVVINRNSNSNTFDNVTFVSGSGNLNLIWVQDSSSGTKVFHSNFTNTNSYYVKAPSASSFYLNTSVGGVAQGNYYHNVLNGSVQITDSNGDGWGDSGSGYPYNSTTSLGKISGSAVDYGPAAAATPPTGVSTVSVSPAYPLSGQNINCSVKAWNNVSGMNVTYEWYNNSVLWASGTYASLPNNTLTNVSSVSSASLRVGDGWYCRVNVSFSGSASSGWYYSNNMTISGCTNITVAGTLYNLTGNSVNSGTCINVQAQNVTVDCQGYSITGTNAASSYGIYSNQLNTTVKNCNISNFATGIYFAGAANSSVINTNSSGSSQGGISSSVASAGTVIVNSTGKSTPSGPGIDLSGQNFEIIDSIGNGSANGIVAGGNYGRITRSTGISTTQYGIYAYGSFVNITNSTGLATSGAGIVIQGTNKTITGSLFFASSGYAVAAGESSANNTFLKNNISGSTWVLDQGIGNVFNNSTVGNYYYLANGTAAWQVYNITSSDGSKWADGGSDRPFGNLTLGSMWQGAGADYRPYTEKTGSPFGIIYLNLTPSSVSNLDSQMNCTLQVYNVQNASSTVHFEWWQNGANRTDLAGSTAISTDVRTLISSVPNSEFVSGDTWQCRVNVQYNATSQSGWTGSVITDVVGGIPVSSCGVNLDQENGSYTLTDSIDSYCGTCLIVTAKNVTLDCQGKYISGSCGGCGIYSNQQRTKIKNCEIYSFDYGIIYFSPVTLGSIDNVNLHDDGYGIFLASSSKNTLNRVNASGSAYGINLESSNFNLIANSSSYGSSNAGVRLYGSSDNNITATNATSDTGIGFLIHSSSNRNRVIGSYGFSSNTSNGGCRYSGGCGGIFLGSSQSNVIANSTGTSDQYYGIRLGRSSSNTFINATANSTNNYGLYVYDTSAGNTFTASNISAVNSYALLLQRTVSNNVFSNNTITSETQSAVYLTNTNTGNTFDGNTLSALSGTAFVFERGSGSNSIYHNHINASTWINNDDATNTFYITVDGINQGNYYTASDGLIDSNHDGWAESGARYPYSASTKSEWQGSGEDYGPAVPLVIPSYSMFTYDAGSGMPSVYFSNGDTTRIVTTSYFSSAPQISIKDSSGALQVDHDAMTDNGDSTYYYDFPLSGYPNGWFNTTITAPEGDPFTFSMPYLFYQGSIWQDNFTDANGQIFSTRTEFNATEPGAVLRHYQPVEVRMNSSLGATANSFRLVLYQNGKLVEIPSYFYNFTYSNSTGRITGATAAFVDAFGLSQTKNYYYYYSFGNKSQQNYTTDLSSANGTTSTFQNGHFLINTTKTSGGTVTSIRSKYSLYELGASTPMSSPEVVESGETYSASAVSSPATSFSNNSVFAKYQSNGTKAVFSYRMTYTFYQNTPYFIVETNISPIASYTYDSYKDISLRFTKGKFDNLTYQNASGIYSQPLLSSGTGISLSGISGMQWLYLSSGALRTGVASIPLFRAGKPYTQTFSALDRPDYYSISQTQYDGSVVSSDSFYSKSAYLFYNPENDSVVNETWTALFNPLSFAFGTPSTINISAPNNTVMEYSPHSPNDTNDVTCFSYWQSDVNLDYYTVNFISRAYSVNATQSIGVPSSWANFTANSSSLQAGNASCTITAYDTLGQSTSASANFTISDRKAPAFYNISTSPSSESAIDPNVSINVTANLTEYTGMGTVILYYNYTGNGTAVALPMARITNGSAWFVYRANFTPEFEANYSYWIYANDTLGNENSSTVRILPVFFDWTWTRTPATFGSVGTTPGNTTALFNLTINVTGDEPLSFRVKSDYGTSEGGAIYYNGVLEDDTGSPLYFISAGSGLTIPISATARLSGGIIPIIFTTTAQISSAVPQSNTTTGDFISTDQPVFLYASFVSPPTSVVQGQSNINLTVKVTNYGLNQSATGSRVVFSLPSGWSTFEQLNISIGTIARGSSSTKSLSFVSISSSAPAGNQLVSAYAYCNENSTYTANATVNVISPTPPVPPGPTPSPSGGGGGGGSSGAGGGGKPAPVQVDKKLTKEQKSELFSTLASYELVRGKDSTFELTITNPLDADIDNVSIAVSGYLSQYIEVVPSSISRIPKGESRKVKVNIEAPKYFTEGTFILYVDITGVSVTQTQDSIITSDIKERRTVELRILDMGRPEAYLYITEAYRIRDQMKDAGVYRGTMVDLFTGADASYKDDKFSQLRIDVEKMRDLKKAAITTGNRLKQFGDKISAAADEGFKTPQSTRLYSLASSAYDRGDYGNAMLRLNEAELTYALETTQSFSLSNFMGKYWPQMLAGMVLLAFISLIIFVDVRFWLMDNELAQLTNEEGILLGLIKEVQTDYFELGKMSTDEYMSSLEQYEARLGKMVQRKVELETQKKNYFNFKGRAARRGAEKTRLEELIRELQSDYMEKGKIETRIYENRMRSYVARLSEVEEQLAVSEAEELMKKQQGIFKGLGGMMKKSPPSA